MADLKRQDVFPDEVIEAPLQFAKNVGAAVQSLDAMLGAFMKIEKGIGDATSLTKVTEQTKELSLAEKELIKIQDQIAKATVHASNEYQKEVDTLQKLKKETKDKKTLGEQDSKTVNAQTASEEKLSAALKRNREEYSKLEGAQKRNSKEGKELLKVIQQQDKDLKKLRESQGKYNDSVGHYARALEGVNNLSGGWLANIQQIGKSLLMLAASPVVAVFTLVAGFFVAAKSAADSYYTATQQGEEDLRNSQTLSKAFLDSYKSTWLDFGKTTHETIESLKRDWSNFLLIFMSDEDRQALLSREHALTTFEKMSAQLRTDKNKDLVDDAKTELEVNELMETSRDKVHKSATERIEALRKGNSLLLQQEEGDIDLLATEIEIQKDLIQYQSDVNKGFYDRSKAIQDLSHEEILAIKATTESTDKLYQLEASMFKLQADASSKRTARLKLEKSLLDEIAADELERFKQSLAFYRNRDIFKSEFYQKDVEEFVNSNLKKLSNDEEFHKKIKKLMNETALQVAQIRKNLNIPEEETDLEKLHKFLEKAQELYAKFANNVGNLFNNLSNARISSIDNEIRKLETQTDREIELAGDNDAAKKAIAEAAEKRREQLDKKRLQEQQRQAKFNKNLALAQAIINTAEAVTDALPNIYQAAIVGVLGALEIAAIESQPIPKYEFGTKDHPGGKAIVGEAGTELIKEGKKWSLSPSRATAMNLAEGAQVFPHDETVRMLALSSMGNEILLHRENSELLKEVKELKETNERVIGAIYKNGMRQYTRQGTKLLEWYQDEQGNRNAVRSKMINW